LIDPLICPGTTKITGWTALANGTSVSSITDGVRRIAFSDIATKGQVGYTSDSE